MGNKRVGEDGKQKNESLRAMGSAIAWVLRYFFYGAVLLRDAKTISDLKFVPDPDKWFKRQSRGLLIIGALLLSISSACALGAHHVFKKITPPSQVTYISDVSPRVKKLISKSERLDRVDSVLSELYAAVTKKKSSRNQAIIVLVLLLIPILLGKVTESFYQINRDTKLLHTALTEAGCFGEGKQGKYCLSTAIGYYIEVTGSGAQAIATNEGIWKRLSVEIDEKNYFENPKRNTMVFYRRRFSLKEKYFL